MTAFAFIAGRPAAAVDWPSVLEALNPLGLLDVEEAQRDDARLCVAHHSNAPCYGASMLDAAEGACLLAGDVVNRDELDWAAIRRALGSGETRPECLRKLRGSFGLAVHDPRRRRLWVVTDPSAWQPVMLVRSEDGVIVSTSLAATLRAMQGPVAASANWVFDTMFFNHGIGSETPVAGVDRLPPGCITEIDLDTWQISQRVCREQFARPTVLEDGREAVAEAISVFEATVPRYVPEDSATTIGLSEGLDCRTVLAALPDERVRKLHSFTFGMPTSSEIAEAGDIAAQLGLTHTPVLLDPAFLEQLPALARDTVFLSDGLQNINRSHLLYTYGGLTHDEEPYPVILTGVSGDHIFRDHINGFGNVPHIMSAAAAALHRNGRSGVDLADYSAMFGDRFEAFEQRVRSAMDAVEREYGSFGDPEAYLRYLMYEAGPRYFGGQAAIANSFSTFRTPFWDPDVIELGFRFRDATLGFSAASGSKDVYRETFIQAGIIAAHPSVGRLPYKNLPIRVYASGNKALFQAYRLGRKLSSILHRRQFIYSEDWQLWYQTILNQELRRLLGDDSRVRNFVSAEFIDRAIADADVHWLGKLMTTEYTLRFIENGWRRG